MPTMLVAGKHIIYESTVVFLLASNSSRNKSLSTTIANIVGTPLTALQQLAMHIAGGIHSHMQLAHFKHSPHQ
jgi:hypothetical protein